MLQNYRRRIFRNERSYFVTINYDYNNKSNIYIVDVYVATKIGNPEFDVVIANSSGNKKFIAKVNTFRSIAQNTRAKKLFTIDDYHDIELDKKLLSFLINNMEQTYTRALPYLSTKELLDRILWSNLKLEIQLKKDTYIAANSVAYFNLGKNIGNEMEKIRPCIIWKKRNVNSLIIPLTTTENEVMSIDVNGKKSYLNIQGIRYISNKRLVKKLRRKLNPNEIEEINEILFDSILK